MVVLVLTAFLARLPIWFKTLCPWAGALKDNARAKARARPNAFLMFAKIFIIC